jgi:hypothetical protein
LEAELLEVEVEAAVQITNVNGDGLKAQVGIIAVEANCRAIDELRSTGHGAALYAEAEWGEIFTC